ncbi:MAG: ATP-grasp fold amidoligase family protein [Acidobacteriota bacterium]
MASANEKKSPFREFYKACIAPLLPEPLRFKLRFYSKHDYWPDLKHPRSLMEKVVWLLRNDRTPLRALVADRIKVRDFVLERAPECKLPAHLWIGTDFTQAVWDALPDRFVIKGNHGSQMTRIVNKAQDRFEDVAADARRWLQTDYSHFFGEWVYATAQRTLVVEEWIQTEFFAPPDWKFLCGNGRALIIQLDIGRFINQRRNLYSRDFQLLQEARIAFPLGEYVFKPSAWDKALQIAEKLAAPFDFIRVDLYIVGDDVYFGEMTNYPGAGWDALKPKSFDFEMGACIRLNAQPSVTSARE